MFVCPNNFDTVSIGTPLDNVVVVANVCLAVWNRTHKAAVSKLVTIKRNPFEMNGFSLFC